MQSGRSWIPQVEFFEGVAGLDIEGPVFVMDPQSDTGIEQVSKVGKSVRSMTIITGPEGGFSRQERELFMRRGYIATRLGPRVFRAETAVVAGLVAFQTWLGDMR